MTSESSLEESKSSNGKKKPSDIKKEKPKPQVPAEIKELTPSQIVNELNLTFNDIANIGFAARSIQF